MDQETLTGLMIVAIIGGVVVSLQSTSRWYGCALAAALMGAVLGALFTYNIYAEMPFPERGVEWSGTALTCALSAGVLGAVAGALRSWWKARKTHSLPK